MLPSQEYCNGYDDDCDGLVDEAMELSAYSPDNLCKQCGKCFQTREVCVNGQWFCDYQNGPPTPEVCNGIDDDCDCRVDEDIHSEAEVFCYTGPAGTATRGACRPGVVSCVNGSEACEGEVLPRAEVCNEQDDDCNGWIDDVSDYYDGMDIVFGIDVSGSMGSYIDAVANVVCDYAETTGSQNPYQMGLVVISGPNNDFFLEQDLTGATALCSVLSALTLSGAAEPTLSAAEAVADPSNPLHISWRSNTKRIFIGFGDEVAQATMLGEEDEAIVNTLAYCVESRTDVYWFVNDPTLYSDQAVGCGGNVFVLSAHEQFMLANLNSIIAEVCLEAP